MKTTQQGRIAVCTDGYHKYEGSRRPKVIIADLIAGRYDNDDQVYFTTQSFNAYRLDLVRTPDQPPASPDRAWVLTNAKTGKKTILSGEVMVDGIIEVDEPFCYSGKERTSPVREIVTVGHMYIADVSNYEVSTIGLTFLSLLSSAPVNVNVVWFEIYSANKKTGEVYHHGGAPGRSFEEACQEFAKRNKEFGARYDELENSYADLALFDSKPTALHYSGGDRW